MFPILSLLRKFSSASILVESPNCRVSPKFFVFNFSTLKWENYQAKVNFFTLTKKGSSSAEVAISLADFENQIHQKYCGKQGTYTIICGPEEEKKEGPIVTRTIKLALLKGICTLRGDKILTRPTISKKKPA